MNTIHNNECPHRGQYTGQFDCKCERRFDGKNDWDITVAEAARLNEIHKDEHFVACDAGEYVWPRYSVRTAPKVGDEVSYSFNGDTYPCGTVTKISKDHRIVYTSEGRNFYRKKLTGAWINGGTWSLVSGHRHEQNSSF